MGPTPEPIPSNDATEGLPAPVGFLSDEEDSDDDFELTETNEDYPPGYMPIQQHLEIQWASDSEEIEDESNSENNTFPQSQPSTSSNINTQSNVDFETNESVDYSNLSSIMQAFSTHGPNVVEDKWDLGSAFRDENNSSETNGSGSNKNSDNHIEEALRKMRLTSFKPECDETTENKTKFNSLPLSEDKEDAVMNAMKGFSLPSAAIPDWAANLQDCQLREIVKEKLNLNIP